MSCNGVCHWPTELDPDCPVHGRVIDCACGKTHETIPVDDISWGELEPFYVMMVCRTHRRHIPCRACASEAERLAEAELFGQAFRPPKDIHHGATLRAGNTLER